MRSTNDNPIDPIGTLGDPIRPAAPKSADVVRPFETVPHEIANVDTAKEVEMLSQLRGAASTLLVMTHRLRAAQSADRIVVLDEGRVVETGTHDALLTAGGLYARRWRTQRLEEEIARA